MHKCSRPRAVRGTPATRPSQIRHRSVTDPARVRPMSTARPSGHSAWSGPGSRAGSRVAPPWRKTAAKSGGEKRLKCACFREPEGHEPEGHARRTCAPLRVLKSSAIHCSRHVRKAQSQGPWALRRASKLSIVLTEPRVNNWSAAGGPGLPISATTVRYGTR